MAQKLEVSNSLKQALTPREIVNELDRFIVGQNQAKKTVAIALRNRYRRKAIEDNLREEIVPKNILMVGPTGVGKTEIARRLAKIAGAPFIKVEATKFTEVGYVGRDVDSVIRDLIQTSINLVKEKHKEENIIKATELAEEKIIDILVGKDASLATRSKFKEMLKNGELDATEIEINIKNSSSYSMPTLDIPGFPGGGQMGVINLSDILGKTLGSQKTKKKKVLVKHAKKILIEEEVHELIDEEKIISEAIDLVENEGIVFLDEIDKIATREGSKGGDVSREGVQRDLLPLIEGTTVSTKYGMIKTDHILFIASGAFYNSSPSDLLPELQGRLPLRVELSDLTKEDLIRILKEPEGSLIKQYTALMATEGVKLNITDSAIEALADVTYTINKEVENIGARRLHTMLEKLLEEISFEANKNKGKTIKVDHIYVNKTLEGITTKIDLSKFIL